MCYETRQKSPHRTQQDRIMKSEIRQPKLSKKLFSDLKAADRDPAVQDRLG